jgi:hypothetical protein
LLLLLTLQRHFITLHTAYERENIIKRSGPCIAPVDNRCIGFGDVLGNFIINGQNNAGPFGDLTRVRPARCPGNNDVAAKLQRQH